MVMRCGGVHCFLDASGHSSPDWRADLPSRELGLAGGRINGNVWACVPPQGTASRARLRRALPPPLPLPEILLQRKGYERNFLKWFDSFNVSVFPVCVFDNGHASFITNLARLFF